MSSAPFDLQYGASRYATRAIVPTRRQRRMLAPMGVKLKIILAKAAGSGVAAAMELPRKTLAPPLIDAAVANNMAVFIWCSSPERPGRLSIVLSTCKVAHGPAASPTLPPTPFLAVTPSSKLINRESTES